MTKQLEIGVEELKIGDRLAGDIMIQDSVLLRSGSVLTNANIARIKRMGVNVVILEVQQDDARASIDTTDSVAQPDFIKQANDAHPVWMADAKFHAPVQPLQSKTVEESLFADNKAEIRANAGLLPMIPEEQEARLTNSVHGAFVQSAIKGKVDLERLESVASELTDVLGVQRDGYIGFTDAPDYLPFSDVGKYGEVLAARTMMSAKLYTFVQPQDSVLPADEQLKAHLALCNGHAMIPTSDVISDPESSDADRQQTKQALLDYDGWLRNQRFVSEDALEQLLLRYERYDGQGMPYGLSGEMILPTSSSWSMTWFYSELLYSTPKRERIYPRAAGERLVQQSGKAFSSQAVNHFLNKLGYYPIGTPVKLNNGRLALVTRQNDKALLQPYVCTFDETGAAGEELSLTEEKEVFITAQVLEF